MIYYIIYPIIHKGTLWQTLSWIKNINNSKLKSFIRNMLYFPYWVIVWLWIILIFSFNKITFYLEYFLFYIAILILILNIIEIIQGLPSFLDKRLWINSKRTWKRKTTLCVFIILLWLFFIVDWYFFITKVVDILWIRWNNIQKYDTIWNNTNKNKESAHNFFNSIWINEQEIESTVKNVWTDIFIKMPDTIYDPINHKYVYQLYDLYTWNIKPTGEPANFTWTIFNDVYNYITYAYANYWNLATVEEVKYYYPMRKDISDSEIAWFINECEYDVYMNKKREITQYAENFMDLSSIDWYTSIETARINLFSDENYITFWVIPYIDWIEQLTWRTAYEIAQYTKANYIVKKYIDAAKKQWLYLEWNSDYTTIKRYADFIPEVRYALNICTGFNLTEQELSAISNTYDKNIDDIKFIVNVAESTWLDYELRIDNMIRNDMIKFRKQTQSIK